MTGIRALRGSPFYFLESLVMESINPSTGEVVGTVEVTPVASIPELVARVTSLRADPEGLRLHATRLLQRWVMRRWRRGEVVARGDVARMTLFTAVGGGGVSVERLEREILEVGRIPVSDGFGPVDAVGGAPLDPEVPVALAFDPFVIAHLAEVCEVALLFEPGAPVGGPATSRTTRLDSTGATPGVARPSPRHRRRRMPKTARRDSGGSILTGSRGDGRSCRAQISSSTARSRSSRPT